MRMEQRISGNISFNSLIIYCILAIMVKPAQNVPVRLTGGSGFHEGRVEVYVNNQWSRITSDYFGSDHEATVICRQLGFQAISVATNSAVFGPGSGPTAYDYVNCHYYFSEPKHFGECTLERKYNDWNHPDVGKGVICNITTPPPVRLVGGSGPHEGRLEVLFQGRWGSVCERTSYASAYSYSVYRTGNSEVICRQLGFSRVSSTVSSTEFGSGTGPIWLSKLRCQGSEGYIHECVSQWGSSDNRCNNVVIKCNDIRLVEGSGPHEGRVEIQYNGRWGTISSLASRWTTVGYHEASESSAAVICRQLGFSDGESYETSFHVFGAGTGTQWSSVKFCSGFHGFPCVYSVDGKRTEDHSRDIGVICNVTRAPEIRLVSGPTPSSGRIEMKFAEEWGTLCNRGISSYQEEAEADILTICNRLGYSGRDQNKPITSSEFGNGALQKTWFYSGLCLAQSLKMTLCAEGYWGLRGFCDFSKNDSAIGISCNGSTPAVPIKLIGGSGPYEGRLEIYHNEQWGSVCVNDMQEWGQAEAAAVCKQLGYMYYPRHSISNWIRTIGVHQPTSADIFGVSSQSRIWLDRVQCSSVSNDSILKDCDHSEWGGSDLCDHSQDVGVVCGVRYPLPPLIRLVGGKNAYEGRLEVFFQGEWGTVCHEDDWKYDQLPSVVCNQIGLEGGNPQLSRQHGDGEGRIWLEKVNCFGDEPGIDSCRHSAWGAVTCDHSMDIGIECNVISSGPSIGLIVGVVVAIAVVITIIVIIVIYIKRKPKFEPVEQNEIK